MIRPLLILFVGLTSLDVASARFVVTDPEPAAGASSLAPAQELTDRRPRPADLDDAIEIAEKRFGGQAAGAETVVRDGRRVHEVRLLGDDGSVRTVRIDPRTGAVIPPRR